MNEISPPLEFVGVHRSYGKTKAIADVSFTVDRGEIVGLVGENGAGKSTLLLMAAGLIAADAGEVRLFGLPYRGNETAILKQVGVVFQSRSLDLDLTVQANLAFHGNLFGLAGVTLIKRIAELAKLLGIDHLLKSPVRALSGGNQRRLEIARALLNRPQLLILDEPTIGLDPAARELLLAHLHDLARTQGTAILWATHLMEEVATLEHVVTLNAGAVVNSNGGLAFATP